ncbi:hypothetical protein D0T53_02255 [Dysgonomonas sp. 216]|uniref:hypothetical protein n=1 Tax=Dysgonomonas sp. 216 TaxID=2302934 RepID=UPI0013CF5BDD|nr:hypothetical protein [Dysgonomonas sp. 216]NDW17737.1 hypothetical protein [Dysgonomonas sp. 216]
MKKIKSLQKAAFFMLFSFILASCGPSLQSGVKDVQLGMKKQDVIGKLGKDYKVMTMTKTEQGNLEVLRYTTYTYVDDKGERKAIPSSYNYLHFLDGVLIEMNYEEERPHIGRPRHPHP